MRNPGWIDLQVNGCSGIDFSSPELTGDDFLRAAERVLESGTGCFLPTLITSPFGLYRRNLGVIRRAVVRHGLEREVPGVHLEGPFISADPGAARDALLHTMACKAAIKGGQKNGPAELQRVAEAVMSGQVKYCPHGRPVAIEWTRGQLEKLFRRA